MGTKLKFDFPNLPAGADVFITGLGGFKNGESYDVSDEQEAQFRASTAYDNGKYNEEGTYVPNVVQGRPLAEVVADMHGVSVESGASTPAQAAKGPVESSPSTEAAPDKGGSS